MTSKIIRVNLVDRTAEIEKSSNELTAVPLNQDKIMALVYLCCGEIVMSQYMETNNNYFVDYFKRINGKIQLCKLR